MKGTVERQSQYIVMLFTFYKTVTTFCVLVILVLSGSWPAAAELSPVGLWKTFDDKSHKPRGTIRIFEEDSALAARIETSFKPEELAERCDKCPGDRKNAPIIGLIIMRGMKKDGSEYDGGEILDPDTGYVYRCKFTLSGDGRKLFVRGYLGLSVFGRTQTWERVEE